MIKRASQTSVDLTLFSRPGVERIAMACAGAFAMLEGFPADKVEDLKTAVAEATTNAAIHGNRLRSDSRIRLALSKLNRAIEVEITDEGHGIQREVPEFEIDKIITGTAEAEGIGLFLIKRLADRVVFERLPTNGHSVCITINKS